MKTYHSYIPKDKQKIAQLRLETIKFFEEFGLLPALRAFKIGKTTLYRWQKTYLDNQKNLASLIPQSTRPKRVRKRIIHPQILGFIKSLREKHYRIGKEKIKVLLDEYCWKENLPMISVSTIGRIIKDHHFYYQRSGRIYHNPGSGWSKRKKKKRVRLKYPRKLKPTAFGHLQMDAVTKFVDTIKIYLLTAIDIKLKFSFSLAYKRLSSDSALDFLNKLELVYPLEIKSIQTDNGSEFLGAFDQHLRKRKIRHYFSYPRCPKINGVVERFNRTIQEEFLNHNLDLVYQPKLLNDKLIKYLIFYNTQRPHQSLGQKSPVDYLLAEGYISQKYWTRTISCF